MMIEEGLIMFPRPSNVDKDKLEIMERRELIRKTNKWINQRFKGLCGYLNEIMNTFPILKENFSEIKKYIDLIGSCEYCKYYIGQSPNVRKFKNVSVIYGGCTKSIIYSTVKYNNVCFRWQAKKFWGDVLTHKMKKQLFKLMDNGYRFDTDKLEIKAIWRNDDSSCNDDQY